MRRDTGYQLFDIIAAIAANTLNAFKINSIYHYKHAVKLADYSAISGSVDMRTKEYIWPVDR